MGQVASEPQSAPSRERSHTVFLPTDELRQALDHALATEKSRELTQEDLAQVDATVSRYLEQQLRLNAQRKREESPPAGATPVAWHRTWWFQVATGMAALATAGFYYWH